MLKLHEPKYRIIYKSTSYRGCGYNGQVKYWWLPFFINVSNSYGHSIESAKILIKLHKGELNEY